MGFEHSNSAGGLSTVILQGVLSTVILQGRGNKLHSQMAHTRFHTPGLREKSSDFKETGPDGLKVMEGLLQMQGMAVAHCRDKDTGGDSSGEPSLAS